MKRGLAASWSTKNPVLKAGEIGFITDKKMFKVGDGTTAFNSLSFLQVDKDDIVGLLDANGKLETSLLPALAISETFHVASEADMLALDAQRGDMAIRTDETKTYILIADDASTLANWVQFLAPASVQSVNTKTGAVVLDTDDISEGSTNQYYTDARAETKFKAMASTDLTDTANIMYADGNCTLDGGSID